MPAFHIRAAKTDSSRDYWRETDWTIARADLTKAFAVDGVDRLEPALAPHMIVTTDHSGLPGNYQPVESAWYIPGPTGLIDVYTPAANTTGTLVVDGAHVLAACDTPGDNDWFAVTLTAGVTYQFGQYTRVGGLPGMEGNGTPLADAYLEIYDSAGNLLSIADGGGPNTPSGLDALMTFEAPTSGTYYVNATSYDNTGDGVGDFAGDYEIFAQTATGTVYTTPYDISSPLHSIDWGGVMVNRAHVAVHNPDGDEGTRSTGQPAADPADVVGNSLGFPGKNVVFLYFGGEGDLYANADSTIPAQVTVQDPYQYEIQAMLTAANEFSKVADVVFVSNYTLNPTTHLYERDPTIEYKPGPLGPEAGVKYATGVDGDGFDADFFYFSYPGTPGPGISLLGSMSPPDYGDEGVAQFNSADERWNAQMLQQGGFSFVTLIHEFGHGMGLAHPHDTGGGSSIMHGVNPSGVPGDDGGAGDFDLNQGVNTMMSYNDGWEKSPYGQAETNNEGYGWLGSLMALDIAVIQDKYGVNEEWATGNDSYVLKDVNEWAVYIDAATGQPAVHDATNQFTARDGYYQGQGTYYSSIWDAGGIDRIVYSGDRNVNIDLRPATLQYEYGGAGWMSYAVGIYGGFTIANGVTIENAIGGSGNDLLTGNDAANYLEGNLGNDALFGGGENDVAIGGAGADTLYGGDGNDYLEGGDEGDYLEGGLGGDALIGGAGNDIGIGGAGGDVMIGGDGDDYLDGGDDADYFEGGLGNDALIGNGGDDVVLAGAGTDSLIGLIGNDYLDGGADADYVDGGDGNDALIGGAGNDLLDGGAGGDNLIGGDGDDYLNGGAGANYADGGLGNDRIDGGADFEILLGGGGNDVIVAGGGGDHIEGGDGNDTIFAGAGNAELVGGLGNDYLDGGEGNDYLDGGEGSDGLTGGLGNDILAGGSGADTFHFTGQLGAGNVDTIFDFAVGVDKLALDDAAFAGLAAGALAAGAFRTGSAAQDADDRIIYDSTTGSLYFDADGAGGAAQVQFASLSTGLNLTVTDFTVF